jgi:hypothetical protein
LPTTVRYIRRPSTNLNANSHTAVVVWGALLDSEVTVRRCSAFQPVLPHSQSVLDRHRQLERRNVPSTLFMAQVSQQEAQKGIDKVVAALRKDAKAKAELGSMEKVTNVLGYGSPTAGTLAVRFNAAFKRSGPSKGVVRVGLRCHCRLGWDNPT